LIALRLRRPELPRPFCIAGGLPLVVLLSCGPALVLVLDAAYEFRQGRAGVGSGIGAAVIFAGIALYFLVRHKRSKVAVVAEGR